MMLCSYYILQVAARGSVLYFVLANLANVDVMYQFSLTWFHNMFITCIDMTEANPLIMASRRLSGVLRPSSARPKTQPSRTSSRTDTPGDSTSLKTHMREMIDRLTLNIYKIVSVALFAHHKLTYSFMVCSGIMRGNAYVLDSDASEENKAIAMCGMEAITDMEWMVFLQGSIMANMMNEELLSKHDGW